jgi:hypothetical protein
MKRFILTFTVCFFLLFLFFSSNINAQELEAEKVHALSKDAKKGYLGSFTYDQNAKEYTLIFVREKKKKAVYVTYKFDYDFNQLSENEETLTDAEASAKFDFMEFTEEEWVPRPVVRVDAENFHVNQVVLRQGNIHRKWIPASSWSDGNYVYYTPGHYQFDFEELKKLKPKIEVDLNLDPKTPPAIVKMANKAAAKIKAVTYLTDEPPVPVNTFHGWGKSFVGTARSYASASGDLLVIGYQEWFIQKNFNRRFVALKYAAKDLTQKAETVVEFDYIYTVIAHKALPDKSIALVLAPNGAFKNPGPNPNTREYYYVRFDKDAQVIDKVKFESPSSKWDINDFVLSEAGEVYISGPASKAKNEKYFDKLMTAKIDNFQLMKIANGAVEYITSTGMEEFESKLQFPSNMKKVNSYDGKKFAVGPLTISSSGDVFVSGQEHAGEKFENINLFHFDAQGKLKSQYGYRLVETSKEALSAPTIHIEFENPDKKTLNWIVYEQRGVDDGKLLLYPRVAQINIEKGTVGDFQQYGFGKGSAYYVDNDKPILLIDGNKKAVFFGADKKDKELWFSRVKLME